MPFRSFVYHLPLQTTTPPIIHLVLSGLAWCLKLHIELREEARRNHGALMTTDI